MNIIKYKKFWFFLAISILAVSIALTFLFMLPKGIDFTGGTLIEVKFKKDLSVADFRKDFDNFYKKSVLIQESGKNQFIIRTEPKTEEEYRTFQQDIQSKMSEIEILRHQSIGASVGKDLTRKAIYGFVIASLFIIAYLAYAFRQVPRSVSSWTFGTVAVVTLFHDLAASTAIFFIIGKVLGYELDSMYVVAVLTILGFSVHDTIVVFDRIRENVIKNPQQTFDENANSSINQTLARSLNTSLTAILVLLAMLILGGSTTKPFILMLTIGIIIGTYSSIFVASPLLTVWHQFQNKGK